MAVWIGLLCLITWIFIRDDGFHQFDFHLEMVVMGVFWIFGLAGMSYMFGMPLVTLHVHGDDFITREFWIGQSRESRFPITPTSRPHVVKIRDSEGDDYHIAQVATPDGRKIAVGGRLDRSDAEALVSAMDRLIDGRWNLL